MDSTKLQKFFEDHNYLVHLFDGGAEIESWTDGGVDMLITLQPFTKDEFIDYVNSFEIDEEIELNRQDKSYCKVFTITQSVADFTIYEKKLKETVSQLENL